jgi:hypothetical protein
VTQQSHPAQPGRRTPAEHRAATVTRLVPAGTMLDPVASTAVQGALALDLRDLATGVSTAEPPAEPGLQRRSEPRLAAVTEADLSAWAARFAQAVVEAAGGDRPMSQLLRWTSPTVYAELEQRLRVLTQASALHRRRTVRPQVRSVHVCRPTPASAEVSVHVRYGERSRALAARLDHRGGRWLCTALAIG